MVNEVVNTDEMNNIALISHGNVMSLLFNHVDSTFGFDQWSKMKNPDIFLLENLSVTRVEIEEILSN